jgi:phosphodiesterase/alkaline phosphatase D-like protein
MVLAWMVLAWMVLASVAASQTLETWPDPAANHVVPYQTSGLSHGPMLGRPASDSMRVWIRTLKPTEFRVVFDTAIPLTATTPGVDGRTQQENDNTGFVDLVGLKANTRYYYGVIVGGRLADTRMDFDSAWPSFRTLADSESYHDETNNPRGLFNFQFSIGCGACQDPVQSGGHYGSAASFHRLLQLQGEDVRFHLMNGDYIYEERRDGTLAGYRNNYKLYMHRGRSMSKLFRYVPTMFTFDDHELTGEQGTGEVGLRSGPWCERDDGIRIWYEYAGWANYKGPDRGPLWFGTAEAKAGSDTLYDSEADFSRLKPEEVSTILLDRKSKNAGVYGLVEVIDRNHLRIRPEFRADEEARYSIGSHHYFDWKVGNCHFFALDTRGQRSRFRLEKQFDPTQFVLGTRQREWLTKGVRESDADFIFVVSSVPWLMPHTGYHVGRSLDPKGDSFVGFVHERETLLDCFDAVPKPVLLLTGDVHNSFAIQVTDNVWEFMCGPMNSAAHPIGTAGKPKFGGRYDSAGRSVKIKWVAGFPDNVHYTRLHSTFYTVVQVNNIFKSGRPDGAGYQWIAYDSPQVVIRFHDGYTGKLVYAEGISLVDLEEP